MTDGDDQIQEKPTPRRIGPRPIGTRLTGPRAASPRAVGPRRFSWQSGLEPATEESEETE
jgi:hypothetical protein